MKTKLAGLLLLASLAFCPLHAAGIEAPWSSVFEESFAGGQSQAFAAYRPSPIALDLASRVGKTEFGSLDPAEAAGLALELAIAIDADIRVGLTYQEARARSVQQARLMVVALRLGRGNVGEGLRKLRSRANLEAGRARAGGLADPLRTGKSSTMRGWMRPQ